jgi:hypothetical protein
MIKEAALLGWDRLRLNIRVEFAEQRGFDFETLMIEGKAVCERRIAQLGEPVQRDVPQVNWSEFLADQSHDISPLRFQVYERFFHS